MDFTIKIQEELIKALVNSGYNFITVNESLQTNKSKFIILRHDVEARYNNALEFAKIQHKYGIRGTYYFRILKDHFDPNVVKEITFLGHEAGYHYDDLTKCKGDIKKAIKRFESNLNLLNDITPIKTICMDGSPLSKFDNKDLWNKYNYRDYGIESEPYFDIDFSNILYLTDTGRMWDGKMFSIRDKVNSSINNLKFHTTNDIIKAAKENRLPDKIMFTFHPQRWNDKPLPWVKEFVMQNVKNQVKRVMVRR
jgi:hypothetical protein